MKINILKTCPFCGGKARLSKYTSCDKYQGDHTEYIVSCTECKATIQRETENHVVKVWNNRDK